MFWLESFNTKISVLILNLGNTRLNLSDYVQKTKNSWANKFPVSHKSYKNKNKVTHLKAKNVIIVPPSIIKAKKLHTNITISETVWNLLPVDFSSTFLSPSTAKDVRWLHLQTTAPVDCSSFWSLVTMSQPCVDHASLIRDRHFHFNFSKLLAL